MSHVTPETIFAIVVHHSVLHGHIDLDDLPRMVHAAPGVCDHGYLARPLELRIGFREDRSPR